MRSASLCFLMSMIPSPPCFGLQAVCHAVWGFVSIHIRAYPKTVSSISVNLSDDRAR